MAVPELLLSQHPAAHPVLLMPGVELAMMSLAVAKLNRPWGAPKGFGQGKTPGKWQEGLLCGAVQTPVGRGAVGMCQ